MKQTKKASPLGNAYIGPWSPSIEGTKLKVNSFGDSFETNVAIIKDFVRKTRQTKLKDFNGKNLHVPKNISNSKYWNNLKKSTQGTSEKIFTVTEEWMKIRKPIKQITEKFESVFSRKSHITHKNIEMLVKIAELKQKGLITTKEYDVKKKEILNKI